MANARTCLAITQQRSVPTLGLGDQLCYIYSQAFLWLLLTCSLLSSQHQAAVEMGPVLGACLPVELKMCLGRNGKWGQKIWSTVSFPPLAPLLLWLWAQWLVWSWVTISLSKHRPCRYQMGTLLGVCGLWWRCEGQSLGLWRPCLPFSGAHRGWVLHRACCSHSS